MASGCKPIVSSDVVAEGEWGRRCGHPKCDNEPSVEETWWRCKHQGCSRLNIWMHRSCFEDKHDDQPDHEYEEDVVKHQVEKRSVDDQLQQYHFQNGLSVGVSSVAYGLISCVDEVWVAAAREAGKESVSHAVKACAVASAIVVGLECAYNYRAVTRGDISWKVFWIRNSGSVGGGLGGFLGGLGGGSLAGACAAGPIGIFVGGIVGGVAGSAAGHYGGERAMVYIKGDSNNEVVLDEMMKAAKWLGMLDSHDLRTIAQNEVQSHYRHLSRLCHPDKLDRNPADTDVTYKAKLTTRARKFALTTHYTFVVAEWVKARDEDRATWQPFFDQLGKAQATYHKEQDAEHAKIMGSGNKAGA